MSWQQLKKDYEERYPTNGADLFNRCWLLADKFDYGFWQQGFLSASYAPRRRNSKNSYNKTGYYRKLTKSDLWTHFTSAAKEDHLYFTNALPVRDGKRWIMPMLDFDAHADETQADIEAAVLAVQEAHPSLRDMYIAVSTGGKGRHGYPLWYAPASASADDIADALSEASRLLRELVHARTGVAVFDAIKATPVRRRGYAVERCGVLGRLPLPRTDDDAGALLQCLRTGHPLSEVLFAIREAHASVCGAPPSTRERQAYRVTTEHRGTSPPPESNNRTETAKDSQDIAEMPVPERYFAATAELSRILARPPTLEEASAHYIARGYSTGDDLDGRRAGSLAWAVQTVSERFDASRLLRGHALWTDSLQSIVEPSDLIYAGSRKLRLEQVAFQFDIVLSKIRSGNADCRRRYIQSAAARAGIPIDNKQKAAIQRLLIRIGWLTVTQDWICSKTRKRPTGFGLGPNAPLLAKNSVACSNQSATVTDTHV